MTILGRGKKKSKGKVKVKKCKVCKGPMETKVKKYHPYGSTLGKNRVTCSRECAKINSRKDSKKSYEKW